MTQTAPVPSCSAQTMEAKDVLTCMTAVLSYANARRRKAPHHQSLANIPKDHNILFDHYHFQSLAYLSLRRRTASDSHFYRSLTSLDASVSAAATFTAARVSIKVRCSITFMLVRHQLSLNKIFMQQVVEASLPLTQPHAAGGGTR
ncbi:hypothetical protein E2C01_032168 [Portunus trituberculatus]|uniref:Uncharacterized protein n=1 Tax=Portunus trituberculatus TaxID=210409 RepID=A0A5B7F084_PORTR|nr:hypothetical protein [Portunus trituberculatus]